MKKIFQIFLLLTIIPLAQSIHINEIMYNPPGDDNNKEFIEVIGTDNLSGYIIGDLASNDSLVLLRFVSGNMSLIVEDGFNYSGINCSIYSAGATIGNNLNNALESVFLYHDNELMDSAHYNGSIANNNGYSMELQNNTNLWAESCETGGSPCRQNCFVIQNNTQQNYTNTTEKNQTNNNTNNTNNDHDAALKLEIILPETLFIGVFYDSLFRITNLNRTQNEFVFVVVHYNITRKNALNTFNNSAILDNYFNKTINYYASSNTGRLFLEETGAYILCGSILNTSINVCKELMAINPLSIPCFIELNLSTDKEVYDEGEGVKIKNMLSNESYPYIIAYWAEDLFENIIKAEQNTSNTNTKTFTPKIDEKDRAFIIKSKLVFVACDNMNNEAEKQKIIIIKKSSLEAEEANEKEENESSISINQVYLPESDYVNFGDEFKVKLDIYKGETSKSALSLFVTDKESKKVSEETNLYLDKKHAEYNLSVKVLLKPDCEGVFGNGEYVLMVEGLGERAEENIAVQGNKKEECKKTQTTENSSKEKATTAKTSAISGEQAKILSFYTRNKNYNSNITLYARVNASSAYQVSLLSKKGEQTTFIENNGSIKLSVQPEPGTNLFVLQLKKDEKVIDSKALLVELEAPGKTDDLTSSKTEATLLENQGTKAQMLISNQTTNSSLPVLTGSVVYESSNTKALRLVPFLLLLVIALVIVGLFIVKKEKTKKKKI